MSTKDREAEEALYKDVFGESELLDLCLDDRTLQDGSVRASPEASLQSRDGQSEASGSVLSDDSFFDDENVDKAEERDVRNQKTRGLSWAVERAEDNEFRKRLDELAREEAINVLSLEKEPNPKRTAMSQLGPSSQLELKRLSPLTVSDCPMHKVTSIRVHRNGKLAIVSSLDNRLRLFELDDPTNPLINSFLFTQVTPTSAFFSDNYRWLVVTGNTNFYHLFDLETGTDVKRRLPLRRRHLKDTSLDYYLKGRNREALVLSMQSSIPGWPGSSLIFFSECSGAANYSRVNNTAHRNVDPGKTDGIKAGYGPPDSQLETRETDRYTFVYGLHLETNSYAYKLRFPFATTGLIRLVNPSNVSLARISGHINEYPILVVSGRGHGSIALVEFDASNFYSAKDPIIFGDDSFNITAMAASQVHIATGDEHGFVNIYRISDIYLASSANGSLEQESSSTCRRLLRVTPLYVIKNIVTEIISMEFNPTGEILVVASQANETRFINLHTGKVFNIQKPPGGACTFAFTPDLSKIFCGGRRGVVDTYELVTSN
ncbi:Transducin [Giardia lamblia P15]|uniref:Transducin n=1 Tax=Giardia intestinalis (strain P15) TaxID=658858 RepID=E1F6S7_GIAIA|nr:Transducin [Giardia lamblia P15]